MFIRQLVLGSGEGQHTATISDARRLDSRGAGVQSNAQGQDNVPMYSWAFVDAMETSLPEHRRPAGPIVTQ